MLDVLSILLIKFVETCFVSQHVFLENTPCALAKNVYSAVFKWNVSSVTQSCPTLCGSINCSMLGFPAHYHSQSLLKLMSIKSAMPSNHLILCHPLFLPPSIFPSIRVFSNELAPRVRQPKYWSFSLSISPFNEYSGLISFRIDWLDLLAVQGTLKSLL